MIVNFDSLRKQLAENYNELYKEVYSINCCSMGKMAIDYKLCEIKETLKNLYANVAILSLLESEEGDTFSPITVSLLGKGDD
jgi:hypothetical protein